MSAQEMAREINERESVRESEGGRASTVDRFHGLRSSAPLASIRLSCIFNDNSRVETSHIYVMRGSIVQYQK